MISLEIQWTHWFTSEHKCIILWGGGANERTKHRSVRMYQMLCGLRAQSQSWVVYGIILSMSPSHPRKYCGYQRGWRKKHRAGEKRLFNFSDECRGRKTSKKKQKCVNKGQGQFTVSHKFTAISMQYLRGYVTLNLYRQEVEQVRRMEEANFLTKIFATTEIK